MWQQALASPAGFWIPSVSLRIILTLILIVPHRFFAPLASQACILELVGQYWSRCVGLHTLGLEHGVKQGRRRWLQHGLQAAHARSKGLISLRANRIAIADQPRRQNVHLLDHCTCSTSHLSEPEQCPLTKRGYLFYNTRLTSLRRPLGLA